jgi:SAM-dependent methyltransferase
MVAGSADTGTPCVVGRATFPKMPEMIVVDRCPAPLAVIEEFARERSLPCRTLRSDLVELELDSAFDVVLINYTLSYIAPESRPELFRRLARALVPGGTLICATIARTGAVAADTKTNEAWVEATRRKIEAARLAFGLPPSELDALLRLGAENRVLRRRMRPTVEEIENCIRGAGLVLQEEKRSAREHRTRTDGTRAVEIEPSVVFAATRRS